MLVLVLFIFSKSAAATVLFKFPPSTNCDAITNLFNTKVDKQGNREIDWSKETGYRYYAEKDKKPTELGHGIGTY